jgi:hypothetical protein
MANSTEYIRRISKRERTPGGHKITIELEMRDDGQMYLNKAPMNVNRLGNWVGATRAAVQMIEVFHDDLVRENRRRQRAA